MARYPAPEEIASVMASLEGDLHPRAREIVQDFLHVGERVLAIEHLCEFLSEDEVVLDQAVYRRLMAVASGLGVDERYTRIVPVPPGSGADVS